ncbi:MAG: endonuclease/exonuclease/phosphatase family protein [Patiriisocius sp.]
MISRCLFFVFLLPFIGYSQSLDDLSFGSDNSFEIVTWNIENFPKNQPLTLQYVLAIIEAMDADIIAIQEIQNYPVLDDLDTFLEDYTSYSQSLDRAGLVFLYKHDAVQLNNAYELFTQAPEWNNFPRFPMVIEVTYANQDFVIINNHYKCCGNGLLDLDDPWDQETRRYTANLLLKQYIDTNLPSDAVFVVGDLNDILTDPEIHNVFTPFLNDPESYLFADMDIAQGSVSNWSFPNWPSHLDHILITDELFELYAMPGAGTQTIMVDSYLQGGFNEYDQNVSDHRPVGISLPLGQELGIASILKPSVRSYPNPVDDLLFVNTTNSNTTDAVFVYDMLGNMLLQDSPSATGFYAIDVSSLSSGLYLIKAFQRGVLVNTIKFIKK